MSLEIALLIDCLSLGFTRVSELSPRIVQFIDDAC